MIPNKPKFDSVLATVFSQMSHAPAKWLSRNQLQSGANLSCSVPRGSEYFKNCVIDSKESNWQISSNDYILPIRSGNIFRVNILAIFYFQSMYEYSTMLRLVRKLVNNQKRLQQSQV